MEDVQQATKTTWAFTQTSGIEASSLGYNVVAIDGSIGEVGFR